MTNTNKSLSIFAIGSVLTIVVLIFALAVLMIQNRDLNNRVNDLDKKLEAATDLEEYLKSLEVDLPSPENPFEQMETESTIYTEDSGLNLISYPAE